MEQLVKGRILFGCVNKAHIQHMTSRSKFKHKTNTKKRTSVSPADRALEHFDIYYSPVFGKLWPSIRISLLTQKKTCAIMNHYCQENSYLEDFLLKGCYDIVSKANSRQDDILSELAAQSVVPSPDNVLNDSQDSTGSMYDASMESNLDPDSSDSLSETAPDFDLDDIDRQNLDSFIPAKRIYSESQERMLHEQRQSVFTPLDLKVDIVKPRSVTLPSNLSAVMFPAGDVTMFPNPKLDQPNGHLCHFMMDAASTLPVIALGLEDGDDVLDLCAAPGGKTMCIIQTGLTESITCNDISQSRRRRLLDILRYYIPGEARENITITGSQGQTFDAPKFDKVLVDVPCSTDRHVVLEDNKDNNLFSPGRLNERLELPNIQRDLLIAGIQSCRPGGSVVYSTCTLSPVQNDGVIQDTLHQLWKTSAIEVVIEDLSEMVEIFQDSFRFYDKCRYGQLVLPSLTLNYGPMYFCKIRKIV